MAQRREDYLGDKCAVMLPELAVAAEETPERSVGRAGQSEHDLQRGNGGLEARARELDHAYFGAGSMLSTRESNAVPFSV